MELPPLQIKVPKKTLNKSQMKDRHLRPPLSVRCSAAETLLLDGAAMQLGTSRAALLRTGALVLVRQLQAEGALSTTDGVLALEQVA